MPFPADQYSLLKILPLALDPPSSLSRSCPFSSLRFRIRSAFVLYLLCFLLCLSKIPLHLHSLLALSSAPLDLFYGFAIFISVSICFLSSAPLFFFRAFTTTLTVSTFLFCFVWCWIFFVPKEWPRGNGEVSRSWRGVHAAHAGRQRLRWWLGGWLVQKLRTGNWCKYRLVDASSSQRMIGWKIDWGLDRGIDFECLLTYLLGLSIYWLVLVWRWVVYLVSFYSGGSRSFVF